MAAFISAIPYHAMPCHTLDSTEMSRLDTTHRQHRMICTHSTELCKSITAKLRESPSKCSADHPKKSLLLHFRQGFTEPGRHVFTRLCTFFSDLAFPSCFEMNVL